MNLSDEDRKELRRVTTIALFVAIPINVALLIFFLFML